ncbi:MAG: methylated-DNA--[protein]-cysteine S-methyltransferase [Tannerella sp.]|jgi:methylated-DNA-[protein]-cysteine S-methyltransferase|nr:methylated-DNA--[protein]-cysteine S-methyltransferase [Tannerella sp.]
MKYFTNYNSPIGLLRIYEENQCITAIEFAFKTSGNPETGEEKETDLLKKSVQQLSEYFDGARKSFDLPLAPKGTDFQQKVWQALLTIPYGDTVSYKYIAEAIDCPKGFQAVGMANNHNPIPIIIPCHRVVGATGKLIGYAGGLDVKKQLLTIEGIYRLLP